jgi:hypothetical protein
MSWRRIIGFAVFCAVCIAGALLYFVYARAKSGNLAAQRETHSPIQYQIMPANPGDDAGLAGAKRGLAPAPRRSPRRQNRRLPPASRATGQSFGKANPQSKLVVLFRITALGESYGQVGQINLARRQRADICVFPAL